MEAAATEIRRFTFYVDGVGIEVTADAASEKQARKMAWDSLTDAQQNNCACLDCIDEVAA